MVSMQLGKGKTHIAVGSHGVEVRVRGLEMFLIQPWLESRTRKGRSRIHVLSYGYWGSALWTARHIFAVALEQTEKGLRFFMYHRRRSF